MEYLAYARSLLIAGVYAASEAGPAADAAPGREPFYPLVIAGLANLHSTWSTGLRNCSPPTEACASALLFLKYANVALLALAAVAAGAITRLFSGSRLAAIVAVGYVSLNFTMWRELKYVMSDYLAVFLTAITALALTLALRRPTDVRGWIGVGFILALLALTKQVFLPFAFLLAAGLLGHGLSTRAGSWQRFLPSLSILTVVTLLNGGWVLRNVAYFGVMNDGRGSIALSTREVFNSMTAGEHAVAYLWFMRHPGPNLARSLFPEGHWHRFPWMAPEGFYWRGQFVNHEARVQRLRSQTGASDAVAQTQAGGVVIREILANWMGYLASMPAIFYRGLWFDAFMPLSLPLFALPFLWAWREQQWRLLAALSPGFWSLIVYPVVSLNIQRYQFTVVIVLAVTAGLAADRLLGRPAARSNEILRP